MKKKIEVNENVLFLSFEIIPQKTKKKKIAPKVPLNCHANVYIQKEAIIIYSI